LTRARIRAPFDSEIITLEVESSETIDNVKVRTGASEDRWMVVPGCDE
jgi:hypothetical protein